MPDAAGKRVLIVGDSLSASAGSPGGQFGARLTARGATVTINAKVGRSAHSFVREPDYASQVASAKAWHPDLVVFVLGTNDIGLSIAVDRLDMIRVRDDVGAGASTWAFGPPAFAPGVRDGGAGVVTMMRGVFGSGFMDLRPLTSDLTGGSARAGDRIHFTAAGGNLVGQRMADRFLHTAGWGTALALVTMAVAGYFWLR